MRKTLASLDPQLKSVVDEFRSISEMKHEMATDAYNLQDATTKKVIDRMVATLRTYATGYVHVTVGKTVVPVKIEAEYLGMNLFWLAVELCKDLAFSDIRIASFQWPESLCASCSSIILPGKKVKR